MQTIHSYFLSRPLNLLTSPVSLCRSADIEASYLRVEVSLQPRVTSEPELRVWALQPPARPPLVPEWRQDVIQGRELGDGDGSSVSP